MIFKALSSGLSQIGRVSWLKFYMQSIFLISICIKRLLGTIKISLSDTSSKSVNDMTLIMSPKRIGFAHKSHGRLHVALMKIF